MGLKVQSMTPFYTKVKGDLVRLVFAYQYFSIVKDDELYHFVPTEGKEIVVNLKKQVIENSRDVFVFQNGNKFIRVPLYQLTLTCKGFVDIIAEIVSPLLEDEAVIDDREPTEMELLLQAFENMNIRHAIDLALDQRDFETARKLVALCK